MIGENLRSISKISDDRICIATKDNTYIFKAMGEYGNEAWITSIPEHLCKGIIRDVIEAGYKLTIVTDGGYNDIELRVEFGYEGWFNLI